MPDNFKNPFKRAVLYLAICVSPILQTVIVTKQITTIEQMKHQSKNQREQRRKKGKKSYGKGLNSREPREQTEANQKEMSCCMEYPRIIAFASGQLFKARLALIQDY